MKIYKETLSGYLLGESSFPKDEGNRDCRRMRSEIEAGNAEIIPYDPTPTAQHLIQQAKIERDAALAAVSYDLGDGRIIQTRPKDQDNIEGKIKSIKAGLGSDLFVMENDEAHPVTVSELEAALNYGLSEAVRIWDEYMNSI